MNCAGDWFGDGKWEVLGKQSEIGGRREPRSHSSLREERESSEEFGRVFAMTQTHRVEMMWWKRIKCVHWCSVFTDIVPRSLVMEATNTTLKAVHDKCHWLPPKQCMFWFKIIMSIYRDNHSFESLCASSAPEALWSRSTCPGCISRSFGGENKTEVRPEGTALRFVPLVDCTSFSIVWYQIISSQRAPSIICCADAGEIFSMKLSCRVRPDGCQCLGVNS